MKLDERGIEQIVDIVINRLQKEGVEFSESDSSPSSSSRSSKESSNGSDINIRYPQDCHESAR